MKRTKTEPVKTEVVKEVVTEVRTTVVDEPGGLVTFLGKRVVILASNYIYAGQLVGVNETCVELRHAGIVYETGAWSAAVWKDYQQMTTGDDVLCVSMNAIECWMAVNK